MVSAIIVASNDLRVNAPGGRTGKHDSPADTTGQHQIGGDQDDHSKSRKRASGPNLIYQAETDFGRLDIHRGLARALGVERGYRRAQLWHDLRERILQLVDGRRLVPVWIIYEAQNLPPEFFRDLPAFFNFAFDTRDVMAVWLIGHPTLAQTLERAPYAALAGRIQVRVQFKPVLERERFAQLIQHSLKNAACTTTLLGDSGLEICSQASKGLPRHAGRILRTAMRLAVPRGLNHLPNDLLQLAIEELR